LMTGVYPWVAAASPRVLGEARSVHFLQSASLGGLLGGLLFALISSSPRRPRSRSISPLLVVLPELNAPRELNDLAARIARCWQHGPVTLVAHPASARRMSGTHLWTARTAGTLNALFPAVAADFERHLSALPPAFAWDSLPRRDCFPRPGAWDEVFRRLAPDAARVLVLQDSYVTDSPYSPERDALLSKLARWVPPHKVVLVAPFLLGKPRHPPPQRGGEPFPEWTQRVRLDRNSPKATSDLVLGHLPSLASCYALRQITVAHEPGDASLAEALVARLTGRRDIIHALVEAWSQPIPARPGLILRLKLRGDLLLLRLKESWLSLWKVWRGGDASERSRVSEFMAAVGQALSSEREDDRNVFVILERAPTNPPPGAREASRALVIDYTRGISRLFKNVVTVRVGQPFSAGERSLFGALAHAGWLGEGANVGFNAEEVAERLLQDRTEAFEQVAPLPPPFERGSRNRSRTGAPASGVGFTSNEPYAPEPSEEVERPAFSRRDLVFISYRRGDAVTQTGRLAAGLKRRFGDERVFFDAESIERGQPFPEHVQKALDRTRVLLVLMGERWLGGRAESSHRRIDDPRDWVHREVAHALTSGVVTVIPILVDDAKMPPREAFPPGIARLADRNLMLLEHAHFSSHAEQIAQRLRQLGVAEQDSVWAHTKRYGWLVLACTLFGVAAGIVQTRMDPPPGSAWFEMTLLNQGNSNPINREIETAQFFVSPESAFRSLPLIKKSMEELGVPNLSDAIASSIQSQLLFEKQGQSLLWRGEYRDINAMRAVQFLKKHLEVYLEVELDKVPRVLRSSIEFLGNQLADARKELRTAEAKLLEFRDEHPEVIPKETILPSPAKATQAMSVERQLAQTNQEIASVKRQFARGTSLARGQLEKSKSFDDQLLAVRGKVAEAKARGLTDRHPDIQRLKSEEVNLLRLAAQSAAEEALAAEKRADAETLTLRERLTTLTAQQQRLQRLLRQVQQKVDDARAESLPELRAQHQALSRDYETKQKKHDTLSADLEAKKVQLEMERAEGHARYDIITPPTPEVPSMITAMIKRGGLGGGVGLALALFATLMLRQRTIAQRGW
jgi:uncharacterized protein involved in exopolysaccharide biosynthesis